MTSTKKVLAVATSANPILKGKRTGLYLSELTHFVDVVRRAGFECDIASPRGGEIPLDENSTTPRQLSDPANARLMDDADFEAGLRDSTPCGDVDATRYAALYLAGGHGTMWDFRQSPDLQRIITQMYDAGTLISGICHGVAGFVDSVDGDGQLIVRDKNVTGFTNLEDTIGGTRREMPFLLEDALKQNGARFRKNVLPFTSRVEVDGRLITGQNPQSAKAVGERLVELLAT